jgi:hypothetical protein
MNATTATALSSSTQSPLPKLSLKKLIQRLAAPAFNRINVHNPETAHFICKLIPTQCPFERDVIVFGHTLFHIPPMCKINPVYEQLIDLRFRALSFLADECGEDVTPYCQ